jgi:Flp pilus assembly protein TadG
MIRATAAPLRRGGTVLTARLAGADPDAGSITVLIVFLALSLVLVAGLVFDAGAALTDRQRAADIAEQAARYAADQVVPAPSGVAPLINTGQAQTAGMQFLAQEGVRGTVRASPTHVTVTVTIKHHTALLSAVGQDPLTVTGTSTATPLSGLKTAAVTGGQ